MPGYDDFSSPVQGVTVGSGYDEFSSPIPPPKPEGWMDYASGLAQKAAQGATLGYGDEAAAGIGAVGNKAMRALGVDVPERTYDQILGEVRGTDKQFTERHPYQAIGAEVAGGIAPLAAGPVRAVAALPTWGARALKSAKVGAGYGAISGFGNSEGGAENRLLGGLQGGLLGAAVTPAVSDVGLPIVAQIARLVPRSGRFAQNALQAARDPEAAAFRNLADTGASAGADFDVMRKLVAPPPSANLAARKFTEDDMSAIISRQLAGEDAATVAADYAHLVDPQGRKFTARTAKNYLKAYEDRNPTPFNVVDLAKITLGEGGATPIARSARSAHSIGGGDDASMAQALESRQELQPGRVSSIVEKRMGGGDWAAKKAANAAELERESGKAYKDFYSKPELATDKLGDLMDDPLFRKAVDQAQEQESAQVIARNQAAPKTGGAQESVPYAPKNDPQLQSLHEEMRQTKDALTEARRRRQDASSKEEKRAALEDARVHEDTITSITREMEDLRKGNHEVFSPEMLDYIQRQLRITGEGHTNPNEARHAQAIRKVFLDRIEQHYPSFRKIRSSYAEGKMEQEAFDAGIKLSTKLGAPTREALADYETKTPAQQAIMRQSFGTALQDKASSTVQGAQAANQFTSNSFKQIIEKLYPKSDAALHEEGQALIRELSGEAVTTRTKNDAIKGARSAELNSDITKAQTFAKAAAQILTFQPHSFLRTLSEKLSDQIGTKAAIEKMKILSQTDPSKLLPTLTRLAKEAKTAGERQAYVVSLRELRSGLFAQTNRATATQAGKSQASEPTEITIPRPASWDQPRNRLLPQGKQ